MLGSIVGSSCKWQQPFLLFFFFQAEDGIRDGHVTGVQTCALPILLYYIPDRYKEGYGVSEKGILFAEENECSLIITLDRSEERRVGKECRSRWWQYH